MRLSKRSLEGEIFIDHRASPGISPGQAVGPLEAPAVARGEVYESGLVVCSHCQAAVILHPKRDRERGWCAKCDKYVCDDCAEQQAITLECRSFERRFEQLHNEIERYGSSSLLLSRL